MDTGFLAVTTSVPIWKTTPGFLTIQNSYGYERFLAVTTSVPIEKMENHSRIPRNKPPTNPK